MIHNVTSINKWSKNKLTWTCDENINSNFEKEIALSFNYWNKITNLYFTKTCDTNANIIFSKRSYPPEVCAKTDPLYSNTTSLSIYYNSNNVYDNTYFYEVTIHEIGHALGLPHNDNNISIMYNFFRNMTLDEINTYEISDIENIQQLYGKPPCFNISTLNIKQKEKKKELEKPPPLYDPCITMFDSGFNFRGDLFLFKNKYLFRLTKHSIYMFYSYIESHWIISDEYDKIDLAYTDNLEYINFLIKDNIYRFKLHKFVSKNHLFFNIKNIITFENKTGDIENYFVKKNNIIKFTNTLSTDIFINIGYTNKIKDKWKYIPSDAKYMFKWEDVYYFVKDNYYWTFNDKFEKINETTFNNFPFFKC